MKKLFFFIALFYYTFLPIAYADITSTKIRPKTLFTPMSRCQSAMDLVHYMNRLPEPTMNSFPSAFELEPFLIVNKLLPQTYLSLTSLGQIETVNLSEDTFSKITQLSVTISEFKDVFNRIYSHPSLLENHYTTGLIRHFDSNEVARLTYFYFLIKKNFSLSVDGFVKKALSIKETFISDLNLHTQVQGPTLQDHSVKFRTELKSEDIEELLMLLEKIAQSERGLKETEWDLIRFWKDKTLSVERVKLSYILESYQIAQDKELDPDIALFIFKSGLLLGETQKFSEGIKQLRKFPSIY